MQQRAERCTVLHHPTLFWGLLKSEALNVPLVVDARVRLPGVGGTVIRHLPPVSSVPD
jgi:hypothetical protein